MVADDLHGSVREAISVRLRSVFFGSFVLAWVVANWQAVYVTFFVSSLEIPKNFKKVCYPNKLGYIESLGHDWWHLLFFPALVAFFLPPLIGQLDHGQRFANDWLTQSWYRLRHRAFKEAVAPQSMLDELQVRFDTAKSERDQFRVQVRDLTAERDNAIQDLDQARDGSEKVQVNLSATQSQLAECQAKLTAFEKAAADSASEILKLQESLEAERRELREELRSQIALREELNNVNAEFAKAKTDMDRILQQRLEQADSQLLHHWEQRRMREKDYLNAMQHHTDFANTILMNPPIDVNMLSSLGQQLAYTAQHFWDQYNKEEQAVARSGIPLFADDVTKK